MAQITDIRQAVAMATTNDIFKKIVESPGKTINKRTFLSMLGVDMKTVTPIYFNEQKYSKNEHSECIFLFADEQFRLYGVFEGNKWANKYSDFEYYMAGTGYSQVIKNFKQVSEAAFHILMITPEMRTLKGKIQEIKRQTSKNKERDKRDKLEDRLYKFRNRKYAEVTHEEVMRRLQYMVTYYTERMFDENTYQTLREPFYKACGWSVNSTFQAISKLVELSADYISRYNELQRELKSDSYEFYKNNPRFTFFAQNSYDKVKIEALVFWDKLDMGSK
ncbi:hypothetical protein D3C81_333660 [compost metagenome]